jgi:exopolysaccharide biosynthesis polyprenyl glycosylphosphotransferase
MIGRERAVLVGGGEVAHTLVGKLAAHPEYRLEVIGSLRTGGSETSLPDLEVLGTVDDLSDVATRHGVARVVCSGRDVDEEELEELLRRCRTLSLKVSLLPRLSDVLGSAVEIDDVEGVTVLGLNPPWLPRSSRALKRTMDIAIAGLLLILLSPLLLLLAVAIKFDSRGPVLFSQERVGKGGRGFRLFKFRTMVASAEQRRAGLLALSTDPDWLKLEHDPRITRVGRWMRRLSLDELPQLWNVLRGQMSMVGPRPLIPAEDERVQDWARGRLDLTPGITGYWQVLGRTRIPFEEMVKLDYLYVMNWSLWEDVRLMLRTLPIVVGGYGAN